MQVLKVGDKVVSVNNQLLSAPNGSGGGCLVLMDKLVTLYSQQQMLVLYRQPGSQS